MNESRRESTRYQAQIQRIIGLASPGFNRHRTEASYFDAGSIGIKSRLNSLRIPVQPALTAGDLRAFNHNDTPR
jgi:hypothetical protein